MVLFAANVTADTHGIIEKLVNTPKFTNFATQNKLNLSDNTVFLRLALKNLVENLPDPVHVQQCKAALLRPHEFDEFLKSWIKENESQNE